MMFNKEIIGRIKNGVVIIVIGAVLSVIPFYFNTNALTQENRTTNKKQDKILQDHAQEIRTIMVNDAVEKTETEQIKETLERIEKKLDRLIEKETSSIN